MMPEVNLKSQSAFRTQRLSFARKTRGGIYLPQYCWIMKNRHRDPLFLHTWQLPSPTFFYKRYQENCCVAGGGLVEPGEKAKAASTLPRAVECCLGAWQGLCILPSHCCSHIWTWNRSTHPLLALQMIHVWGRGSHHFGCPSVPVFLTGEGQLMCKAAEEWWSGWTIKAIGTLQK